MQDDPPYLRIVSAIRGRIADGQLRPGDRVPSTRAIVREWGVAMATATKALAALRQEGLVEPRSGAGTVVRASAAAGALPRRRAISTEPALGRERIVAASIALADAEGLDAVSMRRLGTELGVGPMSLYRHVAGKDELVYLMSRAAYGEARLPEHGPPGWRAKLELVCRAQWWLYRAHPWLVQLMSITRPMLVPEAMALTEFAAAALAGSGLDPLELTREMLSLPAFVRGVALAITAEAEAEQSTGMTTDQWWVSLAGEVGEIMASGRFPMVAALRGEAVEDLDALFEHGLGRYLDGLAIRLAG